MAEPITRVTLFVPGTPASLKAWSAALKRAGLRVERGALRGKSLGAPVPIEWIENDCAFGKAFSFGTVVISPARQALSCIVPFTEALRLALAMPVAAAVGRWLDARVTARCEGRPGTFEGPGSRSS